jgi:cytochrome c oxidase assembly protein subunit 15
LDKSRFLSRLAFFASFFALGVIALGAFTRLLDAGLGCPDWPGCYGHLVAPLTDTAQQQYPNSPVVVHKAWAEMVHRYFVGGLSFLIIAIVATVFSQKAVRVRNNVFLALFLIVLLVYQIVLGQLTVTLKLLPVIVSQHLLGGFLILSTLWLIHLRNNAQLKMRLLPEPVTPFLLFAEIGAGLILLQIMLGAWTSTNYASLSCPDFPFCSNHQAMEWHFKAAFQLFSPVGVNYEGGVLPDAVRQTIQMMHRFGALIVASYLFIFSLFTMVRFKKTFELVKSLYAVLGLLCIQLCLGMTNVILKLPLATAILHNIVAALLLLAMLTLIYKLTVLKCKVEKA